jgi:Lamin Tail Domain
MRKIVALGMMVLGILTMLSSPAQASTRMAIHEIYYNSPGSDTGSNWSLNHEWVQLHNRSGQRVTLTGWSVRDAAGHVYKFGTYRIKAYGYVKIHTGKGTNTQTDRYWGRSWYVWNNTGDRATLENANGTVIGQCSYSDSSEVYSYKIC